MRAKDKKYALRPKQVIVGDENEYTICGLSQNSAGPKINTWQWQGALLRFAEAMIALDPAVEFYKVNQFDNPVSGRFYVDQAADETGGDIRHKLELATPECPGARYLALYDRVLDLEALERFRFVMQRLEEFDLPKGEYHVLKSSTDWQGHWWGCHKCFRIPRLITDQDLVELLGPFEATKIIWAGQGGIGPKTGSMILDDTEICFVFSPRSLAIEKLSGTGTLHMRPLIGLGRSDEPNSHDLKEWRRLHLVNSDPLQSDLTLYVETGITILILRLLATRGFPTKFPRFDTSREEDIIAAFHKISRDPAMTEKLPLRGGQKLTALEVQKKYLEVLSRNEDILILSREDHDVFNRFKEIVRLLGEDPQLLSAQHECWFKRSLFAKKLERHRTTFGESSRIRVEYRNREISLRDHLIMLHHQATAIDEWGIWSRYREEGRVASLCSQQEVERARTIPPPSRAELRRAVFDLGRQYGVKILMKSQDSWSRFTIGDGELEFRKDDPTICGNGEALEKAKKIIDAIARGKVSPPVDTAVSIE